MILRCRAPHRDDPRRQCGGIIGPVPDGAVVVGIVDRYRDARPDAFGMRCGDCRRIFEVLPPTVLTGAA